MNRIGLLIVLFAMLVLTVLVFGPRPSAPPADPPTPATATAPPAAPREARAEQVGHEQADRSLPDAITSAADILALVDLEAVTHRAIASGDWADPAVWAGGRVPTDGARIHIPAGLELTLGHVNPHHFKAVTIDGALRLATERSSQLVVDTLLVTESGRFTAGTEAKPVRAGAQALVTLKPFHEPNEAEGSRRHGTMFYSLGEVAMHGQQKQGLALLEMTPRPGTRSLTMADTPTNWQVGDLLAIAGNRLTREEGDLLLVGELAGGRVDLQPAAASAGDWSGLQGDYEPAPGARNFAVNLSRNVAVASAPVDAATGPQRGAMLIAGNGVGNTSLTNIGAYGLGMSEGDEDGLGTEQSRPALTFLDGGTTPARLTGLALVDTPADAIEATNSRLAVSDSVVYDDEGGAWLAENGTPSQLYWSTEPITPPVLLSPALRLDR